MDTKKDLFQKLADALTTNTKGKDGKFQSLVNRLCTREILTYLVSGVLTTLVNWILYFIIVHLVFGVPSQKPYTAHENTMILVGNAIDWVLTVAFAYVINAYWVFVSKIQGFGNELFKIIKFYGARLLTFVIEEGGMWLFISLLAFNDIIVKIVIAVIVVILNYVFSKLFVFKKKNE